MKQKKRIIQAIIKENRYIKENHFVLRVVDAYIGRNSLPGQFVNIMVNDSDSYDPLLRIPLGIHRTRSNETSFLYKVVGKGTRILSKRKKGEKISILGPLGEGFNIKKNNKRETSVIIAGGHGIAPLYGLAESLVKAKKEVMFFIGTCDKKEIIFQKELKQLGAKVIVSTEDGTCGTKGYVTEPVEAYFRQFTVHSSQFTIYACGPKPMLKEVSRISKKYKIPAQISLDEYIACGIGVCLGCAVKTKTGYKLVCKDGPVFDAGEIVW